MTSERKSELRRLAEAGHRSASSYELAKVITELLDQLDAAEAQRNHYIRVFDHAGFERDSLALKLQEAEAENEGLRRDLGRVAPTEYRCLKAKGWLCDLGYGHTGECMAVNYPHLGGE